MTRKGTGTEIPQGGHRWRWAAWGVGVPPPEENADLPEFVPEHAHLLLQGVYVDYPHHNYGSYLDRGVMDNAI